MQKNLKAHSKVFLFIVIGIALLIIISAIVRRNHSFAPDVLISTSGGYDSNIPAPQDPTVITDKGGRLSWYKGDSHELIAYDAVSNRLNRNMEVYTMEPDGSDVTCVTCKSSIPKGFTGQPSWHPDGEHIVLQVENSNSKHQLFNHPAWGINQDLWVIKKDGTGATKIWESRLNHAALHPHFSKDGKKIVFGERIATNKVIAPALENLGAGGENQWLGWQIHLADFDVDTQTLSNHTAIQPNGPGLYETHGFTDNDKSVIYSYTPGGKPYVDDIYVASLNLAEVRNLTNNPETWDEHGLFTPSGDFIFMSSRAFDDWKAPRSTIETLRTELFIKFGDGEISQLTNINEEYGKGKRILVSDYDIDKTGSRIAFQGTPPEGGDIRIWVMSLK